MAQTVNGKQGAPQRPLKPGQRQQERLQRIARRRRRRQIWVGSLTVVFLVALAGLGFWQYQRLTTPAPSTKTSATKPKATATACPATTPTTDIGTKAFDKPPTVATQPTKMADGLEYIDIVTGCGTAAQKGSQVTVQYTGWIASTGKKFDSSFDHGQTFPVPLGQGQVIKGWDEGLVGIKPGGVRRLIIPPALGYGPQGSPPTIPANATLIFDVTAVSIP